LRISFSAIIVTSTVERFLRWKYHWPNALRRRELISERKGLFHSDHQTVIDGALYVSLLPVCQGLIGLPMFSPTPFVIAICCSHAWRCEGQYSDFHLIRSPVFMSIDSYRLTPHENPTWAITESLNQTVQPTSKGGQSCFFSQNSLH
jgi:hypothetical protein